MTEEEIKKFKIDEEQTRLLQQLIRRQEKGNLLNHITAIAECVLLAALIIVFSLLVPRFLKTVQTVEESMAQVQDFVDQAQASLIEITDLATDVDVVVEANSIAISDAITNFNSVDFEGLNKSISNIKDAVEPLANVANFFK